MARVNGGSLAGTRAEISPATWMSLVTIECCQAQVSATGRSFVQRSPTDSVPSFYAIYNLKNKAVLARVGELSQKNKKLRNGVGLMLQ
jgi:hypothetical protein